jgi:hypothetical protein
MFISNKFLSFVLISSASALSLPQIFGTGGSPIEEGKKPACNDCNTLSPRGKYFKKADNKRKRTNIIIEQDWTTSTSGSTINRQVISRRMKKHAEKSMRKSHKKQSRSYSVSFSISESESEKHEKKKEKEKSEKSGHAGKVGKVGKAGKAGKEVKSGKKHQKRGVSYSASESAEFMAKNLRKSVSFEKSRRKYTVVKVKPRKHRHHTRRITIQNCDESSTYAFDISRRMHKSNSLSFSHSKEYKKFHASVSASKSASFEKGGKKHTKGHKKSGHKKPKAAETKKDRKQTGKRHQKREIDEGKRPRHLSVSKSYSESAEERRGKVSASLSYSLSQDFCAFERVPVKVCPLNKPCRIRKICPRPKKCSRPKPCPKGKKCPKPTKCCNNKNCKNKAVRKSSSSSTSSS